MSETPSASGSEPPPPAQNVDSPLYARAERRIPAMTRAIVAALVEQIPIYRHLPREEIEGEVTTVGAANVVVLLRTLREGRPPTEDELAESRMSAARRAEERVPLSSVITAYHVLGRVTWQTLCDAATPAETPALIAAVDGIQRYVQHVTAAISAAYLEEQQSIYGEERDARRALSLALLTGAPAPGLASRIGVEVPATHVVLALHLGEHPDERDGGVRGTVAGRRKVRRLQSGLDDYAGHPVLSLLDFRGGVVLLPATVVSSPLRRADGQGGDLPAGARERLGEVVAHLARTASAPVIAGAAWSASTAEIPGAADLARDVLRLVRRLDRPPGAYTVRDVLLEYQVSRSSVALPLLSGLLDPLERNPDLLHTLSCYVGNDLDRRRTATALHVHPNTLDYRLRRIVELTGLDPARVSGLQLLSAALVVRRLRLSESAG